MARRQRLGQCAPTGRRRLTKSDATDPAGASTDRSNRRRRLLAAFRKRAGLACESAKVCVDVQSIPRRGIRTQSAPSFASPTTPLETCRRCRRSCPNNSLQSCVMGRAVMSSSWPVGACSDRQPVAGSRVFRAPLRRWRPRSGRRVNAGSSTELENLSLRPTREDESDDHILRGTQHGCGASGSLSRSQTTPVTRCLSGRPP